MATRPDHASLSSEELLRAFRRRGDVAAIGVLFDREAPGLHRLALALCRDPATAEDVLQETFLAALDGLEGFDEHRPLGPYLVGILRNMVRRAGRERSRRPDPERLARRLDEEQSALDDDEREAVRRALDTLEEPYRAVALLHYVHGLAPGEIAHLRSEPPGTVRSLLSRARARLRGRLAVVPALLLVGPDLRGLGAVRLAVLERASSLAAASVTTAALGGILVGKKLVLALAALALVLVGLGLSLGFPDGLLGHEEPADAPDLHAEAAPGDETADPSLRGTGEADAGATALARATPPAGAHAAGHVRDGEGHPIAGARVLVVPEAETTPIGAEEVEAGRPGALAASDGDGRFFVSLDATHPAHTLLVEAPGYAPRALRAVTPGTDVEVVLEAPAAIAGRVRNLAGEPVAGATVTFLGALDAASVLRKATSDAEGRYRIEDLPLKRQGLPDVVWLRTWLKAEADGYAPLLLAGREMEAFDLRAGETLERDLTLVRGATMKGIVKDAETGAPLADAHVVLVARQYLSDVGWGAGRSSSSPWGERVVGRTTAGEDGAFVLPHVPARGVHGLGSSARDENGRPTLGHVSAFLPGHAPHEVSVPAVDDGTTIEVEIALWPAAEVRGRIVDPEGRPLPGMHVGVVAEARGAGTGLARLPGFEDLPAPWGRSDGEGRFALAGVPAPRASTAEPKLHVFDALRPWRGDLAGSRTVTVRAGETTDAGDIVLESDPNLVHFVIRVVDDGGTPVPDAAIGRTITDPFLRTDGTGEAPLDYVSSPGRPLTTSSWVVVAAGHATTRFEFDPAGPRTIEVRLGTSHTITGRVLHEDGSPWPAVGVVAAPADRSAEETLPEGQPSHLASHVWIAMAGSDEEGRFTLRDLPDGAFHVEARVTTYVGGEARSTRALETDVPAGTEGLDLVVPRFEAPTGSLDVQVVAIDTGGGVDGATLFLRASGLFFQPQSAGSGRYHFEGVRPGAYALQVWHMGYVRPDEIQVVVPDGGTPAPVRVVLDPGARVSGHASADPACGDITGLIVRAIPVEDGAWMDAVSSAPIAADGAYVLSGLGEGRWYVDLLPPGPVEPGPSPVREGARPIEVPASGAEVALDLHFVAGGFLKTVVADPRLPRRPAGPWRKDSEEARAWEAYGKDAVLSVSTEDGRTVASSRGVYRGSGVRAAWLSLPPGVWVVRLEIADEPPVIQRVEVKAGESTEITIPETR